MNTKKYKSNQLARRRRGAPLAQAAGLLVGTLAGLGGGWIVYSNTRIRHDLPLPDAIPAERLSFTSPKAGRLSYYVDNHASGAPLVLVHSVNAAASAYEMRPLFEHYRASRPVYALDLPGYGFSERLYRDYSPESFAAAIIDLLETQVGHPANVIALSLGCEFAARAAKSRPALFRSLVLISPSGFNARDSGGTSQQAERRGFSDNLYRLFSNPLWARPLFDLIATRRSIRYFLEQSFTGPVADGLVEYAYATSHQPGAEIVPLFFLSGKLFTPDVFENFYRKLDLPVLALYDRDAFVRFDRLPELLAAKTNWHARRISSSLGLPQFEKLEAVRQALEEFWDGLE